MASWRIKLGGLWFGAADDGATDVVSKVVAATLENDGAVVSVGEDCCRCRVLICCCSFSIKLMLRPATWERALEMKGALLWLYNIVVC